jgi:hypothetical protein
MDATQTDQHDRIGNCWECGYSLRGLPTPRCPECGRPFNPADPLTMNMGVEVGAMARQFMRPPGWPLHLLTKAAVIMSLWACVAPTRPNSLVDQLTRMYVLNGMWYGTGVVSTGLPWDTMFSFSNPFERFCIAAFRWLITPVVFAATILICRTSLPTYAGFWCSRGKFNQAVQDAKASGGWLTPRRLGLFDPYPVIGSSPQILNRDGETLIGVEYRTYFIYRENAQPDPSWKPSAFKRLSSNWFWVTAGSQ